MSSQTLVSHAMHPNALEFQSHFHTVRRRNQRKVTGHQLETSSTERFAHPQTNESVRRQAQDWLKRPPSKIAELRCEFVSRDE